MKTAPVSAVMSAYNSEAFIAEALRSVHAQTLPVAELIVINDGSTDQSARIAESFGARVIHQENRGLSASRNRCVREASQPWIAFIDADDIWEPDKIERQMEVLSTWPEVGFVCSDYLSFDERGTLVRSWLEHFRKDYEAQPKRSVNGAAIIDRLDEQFANIGYFLVPSNVIVSRELLQTIAPFDESFRSAEDFDCFLRAHVKRPMAIVEKVLMRRREHANNASNRRTEATLSCLAATQKVLRRPADYPPAVVAMCQKSLPDHLRFAGAQQLWAGNERSARKLLLESARLRFNVRTLAALMATLAPFRLGRELMSARYYISRRLGF